MTNIINYKGTYPLCDNLLIGKGVIAKFFTAPNFEEEGEEFDRDDYPIMKELGTSWECGHLLGKQFGGLAEAKNFVPMHHDANQKFLHEVESKVRFILERWDCINSYLKQELNFDTCACVYQVNVDLNSIKKIKVVELPTMIHASLNIVDHNNNDLDDSVYEKVNSLSYIAREGIHLPLGTNIPIDR